MAGLDVILSPTQVAGNDAAVYEAFYKQVDRGNVGRVDAMVAAQFLKKSGLPDSILVKIWDLADSTGKGFLDRYGFFVALKLIALAQNGRDVRLTNLTDATPPPDMGDTKAVDWTIKPTEQAKYDQLFASLGPINGKLLSAVVRPVMINSKLPVEVLGRVWELSDVDKDGALDREEFSLAMHLVYKALENNPVPAVLPAELFPVSKRKKVLAGSVPVLPPYAGGVGPLVDGPLIGATAVGINNVPVDGAAKNVPNDTCCGWVVTSADRIRYDAMFKVADLDADGYVNGAEIKDVFLQSGLPQSDLARIWALCDIKQLGRLDSEQFALAMHLVQQRLLGVELPAVLSGDMIPPSVRIKAGIEDPSSGGAFANPEMEMISKDIEDLNKEKHQLEQDIAQKEADVCIKNGEIKSLQSELTTLAATLKQLETQKGEARKRLDDLDNQKSSLDDTVLNLRKLLDEENQQVTNLRNRLEEQEKSVQEQETELSAKRQELSELRAEESNLEQLIVSSERQLEHLGKTLSDTLSKIDDAKSKIPALQAQKRQLDEAIAAFDAAIRSDDASAVPDSLFKPIPPIGDSNRLARNDSVASHITHNSGGFTSQIEDFKEDPFVNKDPFGTANGFTADPFGGQDPFQEDAFKVTVVEDGPHADPFSDAFSTSDPFLDEDPFGGFSSQPAAVKSNAFDPFTGTKSFNGKTNPATDGHGDPFGSEPFALVDAARAESPTPALPPKKSKQPPPRPAPPKGPAVRGSGGGRPAPDPFAAASLARRGPPDPKVDPFAPSGNAFDPFTNASGVANDPFAASSVGHDGFADFSNFDNLCAEDAPAPAASMSEEEQLAWAKQESVRAEKERRRMVDRENHDLMLALAMSRAEAAKQRAT